MHVKLIVIIFVVTNILVVKSLQNDYVIYRSASILPLESQWLAYNSNGSISVDAQVPGSIYTDLLRNNIIGDPYFKNNDILYKWVGRDNWTYISKFDDDCHLLQKDRILLVLYGVDTVSNIFLNDQFIGGTNNMFIRYQFDIKSLLQTNNTLKIAFESPVHYASKKNSEQVLRYVIPPTCPPPVQNGECHVNFVRKTQSSFSWDWGPSFPTQGIWKPIEIIGFDTLIIRDVTVNSNPSELKKYGAFKSLNFGIYMDTATSGPMNGVLQISINGSLIYNSKVILKPDGQLRATLKLNLDLPKGFIPELWWPNGLGAQHLYNISVTFSNNAEISSKTLKFGFRTIDLVQEPIVNSSGLSFYFQVNGVPFFAKGSNWIPADSFIERVTPEYTESLLQSAKDANMNMLRVWGGGNYESDIFYEQADRLGILIWQDLMFACALYPTDEPFLSSIVVEVTQQVRRLQHHASLLLWSANNENEQSISGYWWPAVHDNLEQYKADYVKLYIDTIMPIVMDEDPSRPFLPSSPSNGPKSEAEGWISDDPQDLHYGDVHFYTYTGSEWNPAIYPRARFVSEYGFQSYPSFESLEKVSEPEDWVFPFGDFMSHRQHHMFGNAQIARMIEEHFVLPPKSCGAKGFKDVLYLSQIVQAVAIKTQTEKYRRSQSEIVNGEGNTMGALYWQLNDIWPAPSWASIEYGGKWKMLHYYAVKFFSPVLVSPDEENEFFSVTVISDLMQEMNFSLSMTVFEWSSLKPKFSKSLTFVQNRTGSQVVFKHTVSDFLQNGGCASRDECFFYFELFDPNSTMFSCNTLFLSEFHSAYKLKKPQINVNITGPIKTEISDFTFNIYLETNAIAPFVWLNVVDLQGRFSDNGFILLTQTKNLFFYSKEKITLEDITHRFSIQSLKDVCVE